MGFYGRPKQHHACQTVRASAACDRRFPSPQHGYADKLKRYLSPKASSVLMHGAPPEFPFGRESVIGRNLTRSREWFGRKGPPPIQLSRARTVSCTVRGP